MTLSTALSTAITGLQTAQQRVAIASNNVSNANTEGYSRKLAGQEAVVLAGQGTGSAVSDVYRVVDDALLRQIRSEKGDLGRDSTRNEFFNQMQQMFGTPESNTSIVARVTDLANALDALASNPEQNAPRLQVLDDARDVISTLDLMSDQVQDLRGSAEAQISTAVEEVNNSLARIQQLNSDIVQLKHSNQPTTELEDQRDLEVNRISEHMNISTFTRAEGDMVVYTGNGTRVLLDRTANTLEYSSSTAFVPGSGSNSITLNGDDITSEISTGNLNALIDLRDFQLPQLQDQFDELGKELRDQLNVLHNRGTSFPPPENLYSSRTVAGGDQFTGTGFVRVAAVDASGNISAKSDLDLSTFRTVSDVLTAVTAIPGLSASITNGQMQIEASGGLRVSINELDSSVALQDAGSVVSRTQTSTTDALGLSGNLTVTIDGGATSQTVAYATTDTLTDIVTNINAAFAPSSPASITNNQLLIASPTGDPITFLDSGGLAASIDLEHEGDTRGFSHYFGLNDFFQSNSGSSDLYTSPQDSATTALGIAGTLRIGSTDVAYTATDTLTTFAASLNAVAGISAEVIEDGGRFRLVASSESSGNLFFNDTGTFSETFKFSEDPPGLAQRLSINPQLVADAQRIAYAELNVDTYESVNGTFSSDGRVQVGTTQLGAGSLTIRGDFGSVSFAYDGTVNGQDSLEDMANAINADANLTAAEINAEVVFNSARGGYLIRIQDAGGDSFTVNDSNTTANGFTTLTGLDTQFGVQSGDNSIAQALADKFDATDIEFSSVGGLTAETTSFSDYAAAILSANATDAADALADYEFQNTLVLELETSARNMSGVNIDEEMSDLIIFQNGYAAAARVITTIDEMFDELLASVR